MLANAVSAWLPRGSAREMAEYTSSKPMQAPPTRTVVFDEGMATGGSILEASRENAGAAWVTARVSINNRKRRYAEVYVNVSNDCSMRQPTAREREDTGAGGGIAIRIPTDTT